MGNSTKRLTKVRSTGPHPFVGFRVSPENYITCRRLARDQGITVGMFVRDLVIEYLNSQYIPSDEPGHE